MNALVRRAPIAAPLDVAARWFAAYTAGRSVTLFALILVPGVERPLRATARAQLALVAELPQCNVRWKHTGLTPDRLEFEGCMWLEADRHDEQRSWLALDGEYSWRRSDPLASIIVRRLSGALTRDLLSRVGDFIEAGKAADGKKNAGMNPAIEPTS